MNYWFQDLKDKLGKVDDEELKKNSIKEWMKLK